MLIGASLVYTFLFPVHNIPLCDYSECFPFNYSYGSTHGSVNMYSCHVHVHWYKFFFPRGYISVWNC